MFHLSIASVNSKCSQIVIRANVEEVVEVGELSEFGAFEAVNVEFVAHIVELVDVLLRLVSQISHQVRVEFHHYVWYLMFGKELSTSLKYEIFKAFSIYFEDG